MQFDATLLKTIPRTEDVVSFLFPRPDGFDYLAGQYIFVELEIGEKKVRKPFTISSSPTNKDIIEFTKKLTGHEFSDALLSLQAGDTAGIEGPFGKMTYSGEYDKIALISGGIGITPMISISRYCTDKGMDTNIVMISSNKTEQDIAFRDELDTMQKRNPNLKVVHTLTRASEEWEGCRERVCESMILREIPDYRERTFYICGPPPMVEAVKEILYQMNVDKSKVKYELFTGY
ncbi:ferredoxin--NADP reductase [Methanohalophilus halophilus]|uniref:Ferredoxin-NADP reductase n=1 Tax=Methanohalophilus halophilus TaxID=2177 RepID=A0A1L3Q2P3_9EURY|nr:FAD-binding oxidoreductase [Methanohalophilus halophilus]APH39103.1 xylene monooxygenase [Methanohalophilus halophilus]RNI09841.1 xylene monooxygenase [Methanohalophilus halophilus]SDW59267.1 Ferredoxin-NADP reductase [Methanohalophilus halophilus]